jgi:CRP-like cAMP-binding protein
MSQAVSPRDVVHFAPLDALSRDNLTELCRKARQTTTAAGHYLFRDGTQPAARLFLLDGTIELTGPDGDIEQILEAGTPNASRALDLISPHARGARAKTEVTTLAVDRDLLDLMLTWHQSGGYEVEDLSERTDQASAGGHPDWMTQLLQTECFRSIPAANIQAIFMRMESVPFKAGDVIIRQGEAGDYFYMIRDGQCTVTRTTAANPEGSPLAELGSGDSFGEEALISERERNATVTMSTDGTLMRLSKADFNALLTEPLLQWLDYDDAAELINQGAKWIDVRLPSEFENSHLPNAINLPLFFLRLKADKLDPATNYVIYCDSGRRSSAAAFILSERGFKVHALGRGLARVPTDALVGTAPA